MNKTLAVYPYTRTYAPFLGMKREGMSADFSEEILLCPDGLGLADKDAGQVDLREDTGVVVRRDTDENFLRCDALLVPDGQYEKALKDGALRRVEDFLQRGKDVYFYAPWDNDVERLLGNPIQPPTQRDLLEHPKRLYHPEASVVFVGELFGHVNGVDVALTLHKHFDSMGCRVSTILSSRVAAFFGMHTVEELFPTNIERVEQRVDYINNYFRVLEKREHPEIIVVQIPGGLMPINDIATNEYGIFAYMLSQVIKPDAFILCSPFDRFNSEMLVKFDTLFSYRYGFNIDAVHMSNAKPNATNMLHWYRLEWTYTSIAKVEQFIREEYVEKGKPPIIYCMLRKKTQSLLCTHITEILSGIGVASAMQTNIQK